MSKRIAIAMTHGHAAKWLQISVYSLKSTLYGIQADIFIANSWPGHPSIRAITETDLGDNITILDCKRRLHSHATGLDEILEYISDKDYDYMFTMETDCTACKDYWLDWFYKFMKPGVGMAGFYWAEGNRHHNINPSGTLYLKSMLLKYHEEVRNNKENMFWHPLGNKHGTDLGMDSSMKDVAGVFSETRGIKNPTKQQEEAIMRGVPMVSWYEPGQWLYCRCVGEYECISVPCDHIYKEFGNHRAPEGTYYGGKKDPYFIHYWGGTRTYDFLKHPVNDKFVAGCSPYWLQREHQIWLNYVPQKYREIIPEIYKEMGFERKLKENLPTWKKAVDLLGNNWKIGL